MRRPHIWIIALLILLMLLSLGAIFLMDSGGDTAQIFQDGILIEEISLSKDMQPYTVTIQRGEGEENIIEVAEGAIRVADATCPDRVCVHQGFIADDTLPIVCLPHRLTIQIITAEGGDFDGATG